MKIIITGGGTGGHLFPGIAVAREFQKRDPNIKILFVGTRKGIESKVLPGEKLELKTISCSGLKGKLSWNTLKALGEIPIALLQSFWILVNFRPKLVIGVGGYVTGPFVLMAWLLRIPSVIQEQNVIPGATNKILGRISSKIFISFENSIKYFPESKVELTGNPVRKEFCEIKSKAKESRLNILIFGGSRGSRAINDAMAQALDFLSKDKDSLHFIHQTGEDQFEAILAKYRSKNLSIEASKFIFNMADSYRRAGLVICRAGASTLSELTICGKAAILIPFPFAANNHQQLNAELLAKKGAAIMIKDSELTGEILAENIKKLARHPEHITAMEKASSELAMKEAEKKIVDHCYKLI